MANWMNDDIIYTLCTYLDLVSMSCLAAAHPQWSTVVHHYLKKNPITCFSLKLNFGSLDDVVSGSFVRLPGTIEYKTSVCDWEKCDWKKIPEYAWKHLPLTVIHVSELEITQDDRPSLPEEVYDLLSKVTVFVLEYEFCNVDVARRVLRAVTLCPGGIVNLVNPSGEGSGEALLPHDHLKFQSLTYSGDIVMFASDLFAIMDFNRVELHVQSDPSSALSRWIDQFIETNFDAPEARMRCIKKERLVYEFERVSDGSAARRPLRWISVSDRFGYLTGYSYDLKFIHATLDVSVFNDE